MLNADQTKSKLEVLEDRLRVVEGANFYEFGDAAGLCLVSDIVIPPKFKVSKFEKYKVAFCPKNHLTMYYRKMVAHAHDEKLLMHCFQDNLVGIALNWYMHLEPARIRSWKVPVDAFLKQYKYTMDMAPDRMQFKACPKRVQKFSQSWRELAA